jgi:C-terminal processing protease CtpA/Prc
MNRAFRIFGIFAATAVLVFALWAAQTRSTRRPSPESLKDTIHSAITNPVAFAKNRFTGGVGAVLGVDQATGLLLIRQVIAGSPAEKAGLREGDLILQIDGIATRGRMLAQNVESIRGFAMGSVTLTVQRSGSTNLQCVIRRSSWKSLGIPN